MKQQEIDMDSVTQTRSAAEAAYAGKSILGTPVIALLDQAACVLKAFGCVDQDLVCAAYLHPVLGHPHVWHRDTFATPRVARLVDAVQYTGKSKRYNAYMSDVWVKAPAVPGAVTVLYAFFLATALHAKLHGGNRALAPLLRQYPTMKTMLGSKLETEVDTMIPVIATLLDRLRSDSRQIIHASVKHTVNVNKRYVYDATLLCGNVGGFWADRLTFEPNDVTCTKCLAKRRKAEFDKWAERSVMRKLSHTSF
jgi:hypothetical protein